MARLLLVEDDVQLGESLKEGLEMDVYHVDWLRNGADALLALETNDFDIAVLDLGLPGMDGVTLLQAARKNGDSTPILILTARDTVADKIRGLDSGADDYLVKPFDIDELSARLRSLLRRSSGRASPALEVGAISLDPATGDITIDAIPTILSGRERALLQILMENAGRFVSKSRLENSLYGWDSEVESNTVEVYISKLRKKVGRASITTMRGVGYRMNKA
ncbi:response regulator [Kordiimonas sp.]|uniref:response regulator n=1 Tax=Kordiimonas sp. TaxID=1970157 RepID=UPI003B527CA8